MARGYIGKMLWVDLPNNELKDEAFDEKHCRRFIGGYGLGSRLIYSRQKTGVDPLSHDSTFSILTGPLTRSAALGGSRYTVVGKSPLTGGWGDANSGGDFGPHLKFAGYDAGDSSVFNARIKHSVTALEKLRFFRIYVEDKE
jgi:aldehyde:ferredoxin oxidoreductase